MNKGNPPSAARDLNARVAAVCEGLVFISETDAEIEPVSVGRPDKDYLHTLLANFPELRNKAVETGSFDKFFERLTAVHDWSGDVERENAARASRLAQLLRSELKNIKLYRFGTVRIEIFAIGTDRSGEIVGVRTHSVET